jgi:thiol-disulfide isomerase/thioredoxin
MRRFGAGALLVIAAACAGFAAYTFLHGNPSTPTSTPVSQGKDDSGRVRGRSIPERVPDLALPDREGKARRLTEWTGRPLLINFWATWCAPCRREIPLLRQLRAERAQDGLEVIGIAVDFRDAVLEYARTIGLDYPLLIGEQEGFEAAAAFGMDIVLPFSVFVDREGRIVTLKVGELHADEAAFILDTVGDVDAGRVELPVARAQIATRLKELAAARAVSGS